LRLGILASTLSAVTFRVYLVFGLVTKREQRKSKSRGAEGGTNRTREMNKKRNKERESKKRGQTACRWEHFSERGRGSDENNAEI